MGNVSSADHDKVSELLTRRAKKKIIDRNRKLQQQQQLRNSGGNTNGVYLNGGNNNSNGTRLPGLPMQRQKSSSRAQQLPHPLDQNEFYSAVYLSSSNTSSTTRVSELPLHSPSSPSFSIPSSATTPTSSNYQSDLPYSSRYDERLADAISASVLPTSPQQQCTPQRPPHATPSMGQYYSTPIVITQHRHGHTSAVSVDDSQLGKGPAMSGYTPPRRGSEHTLQLLQQQQQQQQHHSADITLLGTSPEAKDWLKQKPTRSSTHLIHQYNFHPHQYYQQPGSISIKVVNNTCRNMSDYANVPTLSSLGVRSFGANAGQSPTMSLNGSRSTPTTNGKNGAPSFNSISTTTQNNGDSCTLHGSRTNSSAPIPNTRARGMSQPETGVHAHDHYGQSVHLDAPPQKQPLASKLVMSRSKLASPLATSVLSSTNTSSSPPLGSPVETSTTNGYASSEMDGYSPANPSGPRHHRPSSTLSSLRSLLGNHPQGLSLIESLEEDDDDDLESLSDTETGDSEADLIQRTQSLTTADVPATADPASGDCAAAATGQEKRQVRKRPPPQFDWMAARRRFSASSLSTISRDIQDSQKGQHALWKYIGGGNSHAPLRYDIDKILDSGCGLGEWTMEMAKEFPNATVYGIDINPELFPSAHQPVPSNCLFTQSNLLTRLSFPNQYFDFIYQRFLYLGLTVDDWPVALKELKRVMKPGGWIELFEPCMRVHRAGARTREVMRWCSRLLQEERGLDFDFAGEKMKLLCESDEIGFRNVKLERLSIPVGSWGGRVGQAMAENMVLIFQNLQSALIPDDTTTPNGPAQKAFDVMVQSWIRECEENKSYIDYFILIGQRPLE
ncbi:hypothetical protein BGZ54_005101 [Gamsiella multidivaricata]|nr:hypothetical protein BGZ54_005101 [Gamsiella multidivaricata]